jgi:hypothetical protein
MRSARYSLSLGLCTALAAGSVLLARQSFHNSDSPKPPLAATDQITHHLVQDGRGRLVVGHGLFVPAQILQGVAAIYVVSRQSRVLK